MSSIIKVTIPNYLSGLPLPDSFSGWFKLSVKEWLTLIPPTAALFGLGYTFYLAYCPAARPISPKCNRKICLDSPKVVDTVQIEDIAEKAAFCRCWRSNNWPYCDGSHSKHNAETGDNLGPIVVKRSSQ